jgi:cephalosporin hydroxylase
MKTIRPLEYILGQEDLSRRLILWYLVDKYKLKKVLEIGCAGMETAQWMVKAGAKVLAIDIKDYSNEATKNIKFIQGSSQDILPTLKEKFDLIFVDGDHSKEAVLNDLRQAERLSKRFIVIHDYDLEKGVTEAVDELWGKPEFLILDHPKRDYGGIVIYEK